MGAATLYCAGVSDAGKVLARDALTRGAPLIACPDTWAAGTPPAAPGGAPEAGP
ncbi:hypothetical protein [Roseospira goensis]|uniref:Uncharacterized protein n=1 Tax=Roseospira goensis TaxID=391922 RepID=A0A7W6WLT2_9PROT|nr:hypothetical protein [Roseospira goensis]MBB4287731.1 hypothetical protein [Roseospira goensis]